MKTLLVAALVAACFVDAGPVAAQDVRVSPKRIVYVAPVYPEAAKAARVAGTVIVELTVNESGGVDEAKILRSVSGLDQAALDAVKQWKYQPTLLNGKPVKAMATVSVSFGLDQQPEADSVPVARSAEAWPPLVDGQVPRRVGGDVRPPERLKYALPQYPKEARDANVTGIVILEVAVNSTGKVTAAHVVRSIPMLDQAAVDAAMQWEYSPVQVGGADVPVLMTVTVNFTLK